MRRANRESAVSRRALLRAAGAVVAASGLPACSQAPAEPRKIRWGRDVCEFCHMTFGDRRYGAQIWDATQNRARIYDDFGCAVVAAFDAGTLDRPEVRFWTIDETKPETWLDARAAMFRPAPTPMGYDHASGAGPAYSLDFAAATKAIKIKAGCEHPGGART
jgi:hypothetical protein